MGFDKKDKTLTKYICKYPNCGNVWEQYIGTYGGGKRGKVSSQARCPKCKNFTPTFE